MKYCFIVLALTLALAPLAIAETQNLIPDPAFKAANFDPLAEESSWWYYQIVLPSSAEKQGDAVTLEGGKTFLHSSPFAVEAGKTYAVQLSASGTGKLSIEILWWAEYGEETGAKMASPHRVVLVEPKAVMGDMKAFKGEAAAPEGATAAYIRIVAEDGTVTVTSPKAYATK